MHGIHRNACLTYLFIASNSLVVWAGRHKDISKHKPSPAKSWVVRLISKRRQCSAEAKDPILVITLPPSTPPLPETPDTHAVSGSLNISFSEPMSLLRLSAFLYSGCVLTGRLEELWQLVKSHFPAHSLLSVYKYGSWFVFQQQLAYSPQPTFLSGSLHLALCTTAGFLVR